MKNLSALIVTLLLFFTVSVTAFAVDDATATDARPNYDKESAAVFINSDNESITVYKVIPDFDVNLDGKISVVDAKRILMHIAGIKQIDEQATEMADVDNNGKISVTDAKLLLQTIAGLRDVYIFENGESPKGFYSDEGGNTYYFDEDGVMKKGVVQIDGKLYLFLENGAMAKNGLNSFSGCKYLVLNDNSLACDGFYKFNGKNYLADKNGALLRGRQSYGGKTYLLNENYELVINSCAKDNGVDYYTDAEGVLLDGKIIKNGSTYMYENGRPFNGWKYPNLDMYYYDKNGKMAVNTKIGDFSFDANGNPSATAINHNTLKYHLRKILKENGSDPKSIFNYVSDHSIFSYKVMNIGSSAEEMVIYMLKYHKGSCYQFAYFTQALYQEAGYECEVVIGTVMSTLSNSRSEHYWNKVKFSDGWYYVDTEYPWKIGGVYKKTAAEMKALSYRW